MKQVSSSNEGVVAYHVEVFRGSSSGVGTCDEPLRSSTWEASYYGAYVAESGMRYKNLVASTQLFKSGSYLERQPSLRVCGKVSF